MPTNYYDVAIRSVNQMGPGFASALTDVKRFGNSVESAMKFSKGFLAMEGLNSAFRIGTALSEAFKGNMDGVRSAVESLPMGVGETIRAFNQLRDSITGVAEKAEMMKRAIAGNNAVTAALAETSANRREWADKDRLGGFTGTSARRIQMDIDDREYAKMYRKRFDAREGFGHRENVQLAQMALVGEALQRELTLKNERNRLDAADAAEVKGIFTEWLGGIDKVVIANRAMAEARQEAQDRLAESMFAESDAEIDRINRIIQLQRRAHLKEQDRELEKAARIPAARFNTPVAVEGTWLRGQFRGDVQLKAAEAAARGDDNRAGVKAVQELVALVKAVVNNTNGLSVGTLV